ncbi:MAG: hypothetical protein SF172_08775 [Burkholderiales bacterium]|nr:hypothetical protein [Burkholderiales bacterium]
MSLGVVAVGVFAGCAGAPVQQPATSEPRAAAVASSDEFATQAAAFGNCKRDAATRNLALPDHQAALFECARLHAGKRGEACLGQLILSKTQVHELEGGLAHCLRVTPK